MLIEYALVAMKTVIKFILGLVPSIPATPQWLIDYSEIFLNTVAEGVSLVSYLYSPTLFIAIIGTMIVVVNFEAVYHTILWVVRKLPFGIE